MSKTEDSQFHDTNHNHAAMFTRAAAAVARAQGGAHLVDRDRSQIHQGRSLMTAARAAHSPSLLAFVAFAFFENAGLSLG